MDTASMISLMTLAFAAGLFIVSARSMFRMIRYSGSIKTEEECAEMIKSSSSVGVLEYDLQNNRGYCSRALLTMLGYTSESGKILDGNFDLYSVFHPDERIRIIEKIEEAKKKGGCFKLNLRAAKYSGGWKSLSASVNVIMSENPDEIQPRITAVLVDAGDAEDFRSELLRRNEKLFLLHSACNQEFINRCIGLESDFDKLEKLCPDNSKLKSDLDKMRMSVNHVSSQVSMSDSFMEVGISTPEWQDLKSIAEKAKVSHSSVHSLNITTKNTLGIQIYSDPMFEKAVSSIFENAERFSSGITSLNVSFVPCSNRSGKIVISGDGSGISESLFASMMTKSGENNHPGSLYLAYEILKVTRMDLSETGAERGVNFEIYVPDGVWRYDMHHPEISYGGAEV